MNIAMTHFRVGETDGVSLEMDKWKIILEELGHTVYYIAGTKGLQESFIIDEMDYRGQIDTLINKECYEGLDTLSKEVLEEKILSLAKSIEEKIIKIIEQNAIDLLIPNNLLALGRSPHIAVAITNAVLKTGIKVISHHHDFYWEREYFSNPTCKFVEKLLEDYFPPKAIKDMKNVVINTPAQEDLLKYKGMDSMVVPNVFDFNADEWKKDDYNSTFKTDMGIDEDDIVFLQATRVTNRKAIELAIDLVALLETNEYRSKLFGKKLYNGKRFNENSHFVIAMVGLHEGIFCYEKKLIEKAEKCGVKLIVKPELISHSREAFEDGSKIYSLWDAYVYCDMITYPSIYEGWGNQFLEGLFAKKPQIVFEYSIFESDIKKYNFDYISLGNEYVETENGLVEIDEKILNKAADDTISYLLNLERYQACVENNFRIGKEYFSLGALKKLIVELIND